MVGGNLLPQNLPVKHKKQLIMASTNDLLPMGGGSFLRILGNLRYFSGNLILANSYPTPTAYMWPTWSQNILSESALRTQRNAYLWVGWGQSDHLWQSGSLSHSFHSVAGPAQWCLGRSSHHEWQKYATGSESWRVWLETRLYPRAPEAFYRRLEMFNKIKLSSWHKGTLADTFR